MRILFPLHGFIGWNGGLDLARLISTALDHPSAAQDVELSFALPQTSRPQDAVLAVIRRWRAVKAGARHTDGGSAPGLRKVADEIAIGHRVITCHNNGAGILDAADAVDADIIFPTMLPLGKSTRKRIGYLFDFQHRYLPNLFPRRTRSNRDKQFAKIANDANGLVVNSHTVAQDVTRFLGVPEERILIMPFTPYARTWWFEADPLEVRRRYGIQGQFLLVCNHFWTHKDHSTALRAFALLKQSPAHATLELVMTGDPIDYRDPRHYSRLVNLCESLGIVRSTHFLGLIPKRDQLALLRGCSALLQPTLFEGGPGGGSVYEAIGLGVPTIISDIPINREINTGIVRFFRTGDPYDLAKKTAETLDTPPQMPCKGELLASSEVRLVKLRDAILRYLQEFLP